MNPAYIIPFATQPRPPTSQILYNANQTLLKDTVQPPSRYQAKDNYPYDQTSLYNPVVHDPYYYPYEYEEALRETAKKLRNQEKQYDDKPKEYKVPSKPIKPDWIDVEEFASIFREMILYEVKCETLRVQLALQPDFRIPVLWRIFDRTLKPVGQKRSKDDLGFITDEDFIKGSRSFALDPDPVDVKLLMTKHKSQQSLQAEKIQMDYQEFFALFYPLTKGDIFDQKLNTIDTDSDRFFYRTNMLIERLLRMMLSQEDAFEYYRREIARKGIDLEVVFSKINTAKDKKVSADELRLFLIDYGLAVTKEDLMLFMLRLIRDYQNPSEGQFDLDSFKREFTPRLGLKSNSKI